MGVISSLVLQWINDICPPTLSREERSAERLISYWDYNKTKRPNIELLSIEVRQKFTENMRNRKLKAFMIKRIREYLEENVKAYPTHFRYKNDCHKIMTILKSGAITQEQLLCVKSMLR